MIREKIDSENFDETFERLLEEKKGQNVIKGRFDIEPVELNEKLDFIIRLLLSFKSIAGFTYKILFWEKDNLVEGLLKSTKEKVYKVATSYKNEELPGIIFVDSDTLDEPFLKALLTNHFNYEMAKDPSLNLRIQICVSHEGYKTLLDIYDDRGFDIYYLK